MSEIQNSFHLIDNMEEYIIKIQHLLEQTSLGNALPVRKVEANSANQANFPSLPVDRQLIELHALLEKIFPSDLALVLGALPLHQRVLLWQCIKPERQGKVLLASSNTVREILIDSMSHNELLHSTELLDTNDIASLAIRFPKSVVRDIFKSLPIEKREQLRASLTYPRDSVGAQMDFNVVTIRKDSTIESVLRYLRRMDNLPDHTDQLFVVDRDNVYLGSLQISKLLTHEPDTKIFSLIDTTLIALNVEDKVVKAEQAFNRYSLATIPVVDEENKMIGRLSKNSLMNFIRSRSERDLRKISGLLEEEDIYASVWKSAKNRWLWLSLNLCIAFFASRLISGFQDTIEKYVALAALLPIAAIISVTAGKQTAAILSRNFSHGQINGANTSRLIYKELAISLMNGIIWGGIAGIFAYLLNQDAQMGLVMTGTMLLSLLFGTLIGVFIPILFHKLGHPPSSGSNIFLSVFTASASFFILLGLATIFLVN